MKTASLLILTAPAVVLFSMTASAQVQQAGYGECNAPALSECCNVYQPCDWNTCQGITLCSHKTSGRHCNGHCHGNGHFHGNGHCHGNNCPMGMCVGDNSCLTSGCLSGTCLGQCCASKASFDSGWTAPAHLPVNRDRAWYQNYVPHAVYGNPGGGFIAQYPQVYQPTDTTQLGYYYGNVPTWQTRGGMIPPAPNPAAFHARVNPVGGNNASCYNNGHGPVIYQAQHSQFVNAQPQYATGRPQIVRPPVRRDSGSGRNWFSLSSLTNLLD